MIGALLARLEARGLSIVAMDMRQADRQTVEAHYAEHAAKPFFASVCEGLCDGPLVALAISGESAIRAVRQTLGATNPLEAAPGTIRADFALEMEDNLMHASANVEDAERELALWFPGGSVRSL